MQPATALTTPARPDPGPPTEPDAPTPPTDSYGAVAAPDGGAPAGEAAAPAAPADGAPDVAAATRTVLAGGAHALPLLPARPRWGSDYQSQRSRNYAQINPT
ncbi:hypothetical protein [Streptomyces sp. CL12-4]|uniref:hypothetical protein n=1 Tax=Streptomyces sp. CL12-4 TaxID=2810306 RepID=UPI001EFB1D67|nr:hypothetical protein [Streptomyces sp. CL12-4]MCG8969039.1 hypothetical protein [Streptomyces sp. CL12-4]